MKPLRGLAAGSRRWLVGLTLALVLAPLATPVRAAEAEEFPGGKPSSNSKFSLLPKSLQRQPTVNFHVVTELTNAGRKLTPPSPEQPVYYIAQPGQYSQLGDNPTAETPPNVEQLTRAMEAALASSGYRQATPDSPLPALAVIFNYGSFPRFSMDAHDMQDDMALADAGLSDGPLIRFGDRSTEALLTILLSHKKERDEVLRRAKLVGGEKFAVQLAKAMADEAVYRGDEDSKRSLGFSTMPVGPFNRFMTENDDLRRLVEDSFNDCYFVIATAFDYVAMKKGEKVLLWRTKMTVNAHAISMTESLPVLVRAAGPYLGKDMPGPVTLTRQINRAGSVKMDDLKVIEADVPASGAPTPAPERPKDESK